LPKVNDSTRVTVSFRCFTGAGSAELKKKRKLIAALATLAWPLKEKKAKKLLEEIAQHKSTISLVLATESM
jgi:hypothetical protein